MSQAGEVPKIIKTPLGESKASLPAIRPLLGDKAPRWTDETQTECGCDSCQHWSPLIQHIEAQLDERGRELLKELVEDREYAHMDLDLAECKLNGSWPGWEKMKDFKPEPHQEDSDE